VPPGVGGGFDRAHLPAQHVVEPQRCLPIWAFRHRVPHRRPVPGGIRRRAQKPELRERPKNGFPQRLDAGFETAVGGVGVLGQRTVDCKIAVLVEHERIGSVANCPVVDDDEGKRCA
jgi:hypothetical protein